MMITTQRAVASALGLSERQIKRLCRQVREHGASPNSSPSLLAPARERPASSPNTNPKTPLPRSKSLNMRVDQVVQVQHKRLAALVAQIKHQDEQRTKRVAHTFAQR